MNINIVCRTVDTPREDMILPRLAKILAAETGWNVSRGPHPGADLNYFICYIEHGEHFTDWTITHTAAWFSHLEVGTPYKEFWWELSANTIGLRTTIAPMYADNLAKFGPTSLVVPPVDRDAFCIADAPENEVPVVGVSGFVCPGGRKGEKMVARLAGSKLGRKVKMVGSGAGWPVKTQERKVGELPAFYQGLDVYLCSSLIEGIPMPPLEALACGVKVVIPRNVGMMDTLPDANGIYRYAKGDYDGMCKALERALVEDVDREALRAVTEPYTPQAWADSHRAAFEDYLHNAPTFKVESDRHGNRGVFYVAYGKPARKCAKAAIASFHEHMPNVPAALCSRSAGLGEDVFVECSDVDIGGRHAKTMIYDLAPEEWQYVMYLDADTEVIADISFLFQVLEDGWDMVICKNPGKYHTTQKMVRSDNKDECEYTFDKLGTSELLQLNGGVFAFQRNHRTAAFFRKWHEEWERWGKRDQAALLRALFQHPLKVYVLGNEWNTITRYDPPEKSAGILHYPMTARRWRGKIQGRSDSAEAWKAVRAFEREGK